MTRSLLTVPYYQATVSRDINSLLGKAKSVEKLRVFFHDRPSLKDLFHVLEALRLESKSYILWLVWMCYSRFFALGCQHWQILCLLAKLLFLCVSGCWTLMQPRWSLREIGSSKVAGSRRCSLRYNLWKDLWVIIHLVHAALLDDSFIFATSLSMSWWCLIWSEIYLSRRDGKLSLILLPQDLWWWEVDQ